MPVNDCTAKKVTELKNKNELKITSNRPYHRYFDVHIEIMAAKIKRIHSFVLFENREEKQFTNQKFPMTVAIYALRIQSGIFVGAKRRTSRTSSYQTNERNETQTINITMAHIVNDF